MDIQEGELQVCQVRIINDFSFFRQVRDGGKNDGWYEVVWRGLARMITLGGLAWGSVREEA